MPTAIITGASQGIGAGLVEGFLGESYDVVATALDATRKLSPSSHLLLVDGDLGKRETAAEVVRTAADRFGAVDVLVNNVGIYRAKPFTECTEDDLDALLSVNLVGFVHLNAVAPGVVNTPLHEDDPKDDLKKQQPMGSLTEVKDIVEAVLYLSRARQVTGQVLYVDGGARVGRW
jgi:NAD(P)-dependent dehydrogenase (short-subunit alcohol dehydrogenase family)